MSSAVMPAITATRTIAFSSSAARVRNRGWRYSSTTTRRTFADRVGVWSSAAARLIQPVSAASRDCRRQHADASRRASASEPTFRSEVHAFADLAHCCFLHPCAFNMCQSRCKKAQGGHPANARQACAQRCGPGCHDHDRTAPRRAHGQGPCRWVRARCPMYGCVPPKRNALAGALTDLVKGSDAVGGAVSALSGRHTRSRRGSSTPHQSF